MASITREANGRRTVQFVGADGKRRSIRLGKVSQRSAEGVKVRIEALVTRTDYRAPHRRRYGPVADGAGYRADRQAGRGGPDLETGLRYAGQFP